MLGAFPLHVHALFTCGHIYGSLLAAAFLEFNTTVIGSTTNTDVSETAQARSSPVGWYEMRPAPHCVRGFLLKE